MKGIVVMTPEQQHTTLRVLSIFHYVLGAFLFFLACFPLIYFLIGILMMIFGVASETSGNTGSSTVPYFVVGGVFMLIGGMIILFALALGFCLVFAGRCMMGRRHYMFCLITAVVECLFMPLGTLLGIASICFLALPDIKEAFERPPLPS